MSHIFISYSKKDSKYALNLAQELERRGFDVWIDRQGIESGDDWELTIFDAIDKCAAFIVIMTPESYQSRWVRRECQHAEERNKQVFPILFKGEKFPRYNLTQYIDVRDGELPNDEYFERLAKSAPQRGKFIIETAQNRKRLEDVAKILANFNIESNVTGVIPETPNLNGILPDPFEWIVIPAGQVTLQDARQIRNGTSGGVFAVPSFYIGKYPITNAQFKRFIDADDGYHKSEWWAYSEAGEAWHKLNKAFRKLGEDDLPVTAVSWYDAIAFCRWLTTKIDPFHQVSLPTEAQWQRAAQGDTGWLYPWGNAFDVERCNGFESGQKKLTSALKYVNGVSPFGVMDMSGNAWEWCLTRWGDDSTELDGSDPRALRGGSYINPISTLNITSRREGNINQPSPQVGFRIILASLLQDFDAPYTASSNLSF